MTSNIIERFLPSLSFPAYSVFLGGPIRCLHFHPHVSFYLISSWFWMIQSTICWCNPDQCWVVKPTTFGSWKIHRFNDQTIGKMEDFAGQISLIPPKRPAIPVLGTPKRSHAAEVPSNQHLPRFRWPNQGKKWLVIMFFLMGNIWNMGNIWIIGYEGYNGWRYIYIGI